MAEEFNPYHVWLGIPPEEQPANHYRLLGIKPFETSGDVIDSAADRQMAHLRTFQSGKHGELTQRLLNEVAAVRICLLDPKKRAAYDQQLRAKLAAASPAAASGAELPAAGGSAIQRQPPRRATGPVPASPAANIPTAAPLARIIHGRCWWPRCCTAVVVILSTSSVGNELPPFPQGRLALGGAVRRR